MGSLSDLRGDTRPPVHPRLPLPEDGALSRPGLQPGTAGLPDAAGRTLKGTGQFERISWDEGTGDVVAARFAEIAASPDGPQAILPYSYYGTMGKLQASSLDRRFFHRLGASIPRPDHLRFGRRSAGYEYTLGREAGWAPTRWECPTAS